MCCASSCIGGGRPADTKHKPSQANNLSDCGDDDQPGLDFDDIIAQMIDIIKGRFVMIYDIMIKADNKIRSLCKTLNANLMILMMHWR